MGDKELGSAQRALGNVFRVFLKPVPAALDLFCVSVAPSRCRPIYRAVQARKSLNPTFGPSADGAGGGRLTGVLEIPGEFFVLFQVGTRRQGKGVRHTNLLSNTCPAPPRICSHELPSPSNHSLSYA